MKRGITKISLFIWVVTIGGFVGSTMHYHSESLHCLEHNDEQHFTENDQLCPIGVVKKNQLVHHTHSVEIVLKEFGLIIQPIDFYAATSFTTYKKNRAPPSLA